MEFSVIIPTFNRAGVLAKTLEALKTQTTPAHLARRPWFEVIVVDDGSQDDTPQRVECATSSFPVPLHYLYQDNRRQGAARNLGSRTASGRYLVFLGDDTVPEADFLLQHQRAHKAHPEQVAVIGYTPWAQELKPTRFMGFVGEEGWQFGFSLIEDPNNVPFNFLYTSNLSLPRSLFLKTGGFDEDFREYGWEDVELGWRLKQLGVRLVYQAAAVARHHHPTTISSFIERQRQVGRAAWTLYRKHPELGKFLGLQPMPRQSWSLHLKMTLLTWACRLTETSQLVDLSRYYPDLMTYHYCRGVLNQSHGQR